MKDKQQREKDAEIKDLELQVTIAKYAKHRQSVACGIISGLNRALKRLANAVLHRRPITSLTFTEYLAS